MRLRYERQRNDEQYEEGAFCSRLYHTQTFFFFVVFVLSHAVCLKRPGCFYWYSMSGMFSGTVMFCLFCFFYALFLILLCAATNSSIRRQASLVLQWCKRRVVPISAFLLIIVVMNFYHDFFFSSSSFSSAIQICMMQIWIDNINSVKCSKVLPARYWWIEYVSWVILI